jgi:hypothetical protein
MRTGRGQDPRLFVAHETTGPGPLGRLVQADHEHAVAFERGFVHVAFADGPREQVLQPRQEPVRPDFAGLRCGPGQARRPEQRIGNLGDRLACHAGRVLCGLQRLHLGERRLGLGQCRAPAVADRFDVGLDDGADRFRVEAHQASAGARHEAGA